MNSSFEWSRRFGTVRTLLTATVLCAGAAPALIALLLSTALATLARASDHLDSPATVANPEADIGDVYAWTSAEGRQLNLAMTIQGHTFSDRVQYVWTAVRFSVIRALRRPLCAALPQRTQSNVRSATQTLHPGTRPTQRASRGGITDFACTPLCAMTLSTITSRGY
jgi:hypothetical protein